MMIKNQSWRQVLFPSSKKHLCSTCLDQLQPISGAGCNICSRPFTQLTPEFIVNNTCMDCVRWQQHPQFQDKLTKNISLYVYNDFLKEIIARFKFRGDYQLAYCFAPELKTALKKIEFDVAIPIPLSRERLKERGFNQSEALARAAGLQTFSGLIRIHAEKQSKKTRKERLSQQSVFTINSEYDCREKSVLIIDDIYTTGSTLRHAAEQLIVAGAKEVQSLTLARG